MRLRSNPRIAAVLVAAFVVPAAPVSAGWIEDAAFGLGYIGFDISGQHNPLSGGDDVLVVRNFVGNPLDFGLSELTLRGPISLDISTGTRLIPELDISFRTALNADASPSPLSFSFASDLGSIETNVDGTYFVDSNLKINRLGFYDVTLRSSIRSTVEVSGPGESNEQQFDSDFGPITLSGNVYVDLVAVLTNPLFERAGQENPFVTLSGPGSLSDLLLNPGAADQALLASGADPAAQARRQSPSLFASVVDGPFAGSRLGNLTGQAERPATVGMGSVVPEPTVLLLVLAALPAVLGLRRRRAV